MPLLILLVAAPIGIALALSLHTTGRRRIAAWLNLALLGLPVLVAGGGGAVLRTQELAWRSCVKLPCGLAFVGGVLLLLAWGGIALWKLPAEHRPWVRALERCFSTAAVCFLLLVVFWYGLLFSAIWAGEDRVVEKDGRRFVVEHVWMDDDYYEYHGPLTRGANRIWW